MRFERVGLRCSSATDPDKSSLQDSITREMRVPRVGDSEQERHEVAREVRGGTQLPSSF
jgi:hypothetical protein